MDRLHNEKTSNMGKVARQIHVESTKEERKRETENDVETLGRVGSQGK